MGKRTDTDINDLQRRLDEAEDTLRAIRQGEVDALMIDEMNEGAVSVSPDSYILYSNRNFAGILGLTENNASGIPFGDFVIPDMRDQFLADVEKACQQSFRS